VPPPVDRGAVADAGEPPLVADGIFPTTSPAGLAARAADAQEEAVAVAAPATVAAAAPRKDRRDRCIDFSFENRFDKC